MQKLIRIAENAGVTITVYHHMVHFVELCERYKELQHREFFPANTPLFCLIPHGRVASENSLKPLISAVAAYVRKIGFMSFFLMLDLDDILAVQHLQPEALIEVVTKDGRVMVVYDVQVPG